MFRVVLASLLAQAAAFGSFCADRGDLYWTLLVRRRQPIKPCPPPGTLRPTHTHRHTHRPTRTDPNKHTHERAQGDIGEDVNSLAALGYSGSNICSAAVADDPSLCDYTDSDTVFSAFLCISTCQVPACGGDINPIELLFESLGTFTSCTDAADTLTLSDGFGLSEDLWEYLCGFGEDRRRLTTKDGAKHAPSPALQLKLPSVQRAVAKAVAAARNLAK